MHPDDEGQPTSAQGVAEPFTRDQLQQLADGMVMGDVWRAVQDAPDAPKSESGMRAFHRAAMRLGLMPRDTDVADFLDRVRQEDFVAVNQRRDTEGNAGGQP